MPGWRRWAIGLLALVLLALFHRSLLFPPKALTMVDEPCAPVAGTIQMVPRGDWAAVCAYHADNAQLIAAGIRPQLVLFGDSLVQDWTERQPGPFGSGWVGRGVRGQGTTRMLARFRSDVIALKPQTVIIAGGTNDLIAADTLIGPDQSLANIETLVDLAQANGIAVILATLPPVERFPTRPGFAPQAFVPRLNQRLRELAQRRGLVLADFHAALVAPGGATYRPGFSDDGIHPNPAAYRALEPVVRTALAQSEAKRNKSRP
jgi:lysophospholipase L1-like esterase